MTTAFVLDEKEGTLEIDYILANLTRNERLSVFINGEERCKWLPIYYVQIPPTRTPRARSHL
jgi:hypothetical protein